jgi:zinc protease
MKILPRLFAAGALALAFAGCASAATPSSAAAAAPARIADRVIRTRVAGIDLIICRTGVQDVISFHGSLPAGDRFAPPGNVAIATLVGEMLDKGTARQDKFAIADQLESVGAAIGFETGSSTLGFSGKFLKKDLALVVGLLAEQLRTPAFAADELTKLKQQLNGYFQRQLESTDYRAGVAFAQALYPAGHPNHDPGTEAYLAGIKAASVNDLKKFHAQYFGPAGAVLVFVGDVDPAALQAEVTQAFAGWTGGVKLDAVAKAQSTATARTLPVAMPDKTSVTVLWGQATGLRYTDPDTLALRVGSAILGSGFTGRLMATVRDKEGLTYGIGAAVTNDTFTDGEWRISATFAPSLLEKGIASTRRELTAWIERGVTADELARRKTNLAGSFQVGLATTDGLAASLLAAINRGLDVSWLDEYPKRIEALTLEQVNAAIKKHLDPSKMTLVEAGTLPGADAKKP